MTPGPKPKPVELKRFEGNRGKRKLPEPITIGGRPSNPPPPPADLPEEGRAFWTDFVEAIFPTGMLDRVDVVALREAAFQYARAEQARRALREEMATPTPLESDGATAY